jgi:class 3 adenylate cyclase
LRIGLHWGSTAYIGRLLTTGRTEITALGDEVNEAARIEASATGGRTLASKQLLERLDETDAGALAVAVEHLQYTQRGKLPHLPAKARRDAPTIEVVEL